MFAHTVSLEGRDPRNPKLTYEEANEMLAKGFRFSIYRPQEDLFRVSIPYQTVQDGDRQTLTFMQDE